jgi:ankyrin repeat protein
MWKNLPIEIALLKNHYGIVKYLINNDKFSVDTHFGNGNTILLFYLLDIDESTFDKIKYIIEEKKGNSNISNSNKMNSFHFLTHFTYRAYLSTFIPFNEKQKLTEKKHNSAYIPKYREILKKYINFFKEKGCEPELENNIGQTPIMLALQNKNFEFAKIFIELFNKELDIKHLDNNGFNIFDYAFKNGCSLTDECIEFINTMFKIYDKEIDDQFLNQYTRYGRNSLLNLCEDYALHIYERLSFINKKNAVDYIRYEKNKLVIPIKYKKEIEEKSYKELKEFINKKFYPLIEELIKRGGDINCHTEEKKFKNKEKEFEKYKYFNNYGKIYPIMYLLSYPESDELINVIKKNININCTDAKNQTLLMYLLELQEQIKSMSKANYQKNIRLPHSKNFTIK